MKERTAPRQDDEIALFAGAATGFGLETAGYLVQADARAARVDLRNEDSGKTAESPVARAAMC